jgi:hypothetical protein
MFRSYSAIVGRLSNLSKSLHCIISVIKMSYFPEKIFHCFYFRHPLITGRLRTSLVTFSRAAFLLRLQYLLCYVIVCRINATKNYKH